MILQALNGYYDLIARAGDVPAEGFSAQKVSFCVVLETDGALHAFEPVVSEVVRGRGLPKQLVVPGQAKPSGGGINPCFLWDNATYMLGLVPEGREDEWARRRFEGFRDRHLEAEGEINDPAFSAVCRFLQSWDPKEVANHPDLAEMTRSFGVFRLRAREGYVHELRAVVDWWSTQDADDGDDVTGTCLVTGQTAALARLHQPKIKGVRDTQSAGATLVSFNLDAFTSYGKGQGHNAPVSKRAAFQYATALNHLLNDPQRRVQIADATTVFWTEKPTLAERVVPTLFGTSARASPETQDAKVLAAVHAFLARLRAGKAGPAASELGDPATPFYVLGLSPNASRVSVRYWLVGTVGQFSERLAEHLRDLEIVGARDRPPTVHELLRETAPPRSGWADEGKIPPLLAGARSPRSWPGA